MVIPASEFVQWYYLIYLLPGGVALLLLLLSALGGGMHHHHGGGGHGHHGLGHHGAAHHAPATHSHAPAAAHAPAAHSPAHGAKHASPRAAATGRDPGLLAFFGLGRVPAPLVWGSALLGWGLFGFWGTQFWQQHFPLAFVLPALATAAGGAVATEKVTVETAARLLPRDESYATGAVDLCGLTGTVVFPVDAARGRVHVYDVHGSLHEMSARIAPDALRNEPAIMRGRKVLVVDYDAVKDEVIVEETG